MLSFRRITSTILCLLMLCSFFSVFAETLEYSVLNNEYVRVLGRGEVINDNARTFNWPNSGFEFEFSGTKAEVYVDRATIIGIDKDVNGSYFNVAIYNGDTLVRVERIKLEEGWNVFYEEKTGDDIPSDEPCDIAVSKDCLLYKVTVEEGEQIVKTGNTAMAGCGTYAKLEGFAFLPVTCFTMALTTFVGQNLGAKQYELAKKEIYEQLIRLKEMIGK